MNAISDGFLTNETLMPVFEEITDWQLSVVRRYPEASFSVVVIEPRLDVDFTPRERADKLLEFYATVRQTVRASDLTSQGRGNEIWVLLPHSDAQGAVARLRAHFAAVKATVAIEAAGYAVRHAGMLPDSAAQLMGDLRQMMP